MNDNILSLVIDNMPGLVFYKAKDLTYLGANKKFISFFELEHLSPLTGKKDSELGLPNEYQNYLSKYDDKVVVSAKSVYSIRETLPQYNGKLITLSFDKHPIFDSNKQLVGILGVTSSISFHTKHSQAYLDNIIETIPYLIFWKSDDLVYRGCNRKFLDFIGKKSANEIIGKNDYELGWGDGEADDFRAADKKVMSGHPQLHREELLLRADGTKLTMSVSKVPLIDSNGQCIGVLGISTDITDRKLAEAREKMALQQLKLASMAAQAASRAKVQFVQNMQHDIRTPASGIWAVLADLAEQEENPGKREKLILLRDSAKQLLHICNEVIAFDKMDRGEVPFLTKKIALKQLASKVIDLNQAAAFKKGLHLSLLLGEQLPLVVKGDEHRVSRILINLIGNAIKFTEKGNVSLSIKLIKDGKKEVILQFAIQDTGMGIPKEKKNFIYEKFNRLTPANQGVYRGSGLGLRIVKQYVAELNGELEVSSALGKGTIFYVSIPFEKPLLEEIYDESFTLSKEDVKEELIEEDKAVPVNFNVMKAQLLLKNNLRMLFIEDDLLASIVTQSALQSIFSEIKIVSTVGEAKKLLDEIQFDMVLSDIGLPDGSGIDVVQYVKANKQSLNYTTPFFALTAHNDAKKIQEAKQGGFLVVLIKPFRKEFLQSLIIRYINKGMHGIIEEELLKSDDLADTSIIDIEFTRNLFDKDEQFTLGIVKALREQLPKEVELIQEYYSRNEIEKLNKLLDHLASSLCYCSTPNLQKAIENLHQQLATTSSLNELESLFHNLNTELKRLIDVLERI